MARNGYCEAYEGLKRALREAERQRDTDTAHRLGVEIERFAAATAADPRRLRSMALEQAELAAEVRAIADRQEVPRRVLDPVHDASFAKLWLAALPDRQLRLLQRCLTDEVRRRGNAVVLSAAE